MSTYGGTAVSYRSNIVVIIATVFMANLDLWAINVALTSIGKSLGHVSLANLSWVLNAYAITLAALLFTASRLGRRIGNYKLFTWGVFVFTVGSLLCAVTPSFSLLMTGRVIQAAGAAALLPTSLVLLIATAPAGFGRQAGHIWAAAGGIGAALGPALGGLLTDASWRWVFLINVPVGLVMLYAGARVLPRLPVRTTEPRPDMLGAGLLAISIAALTGGLVQAPHWGWIDGRTLTTFAMFLIAVGGFVVRRASHSVPFIERRDRFLTVSNLANMTLSAASALFLLSITLWCQNVWHYSPLTTGFALSPAPLLVPPVTVLTVPLIRKIGPKPVYIVGAIIYATAPIWMMQTAGANPTYVGDVLPSLVLAGVGFAMPAATLLVTTATAKPPERAVTGSAVFNAGRQLGATFGVTLLVTVLGVQSQVAHLFRVAWLVGAGLALAAAILCFWLPRAQRGAGVTPQDRFFDVPHPGH